MISVQETPHDEVRRVRHVPVFELERWHPIIATAWVLSRNKSFTQACTRAYGDANTVQLEANEWRRVSFLSAADNQASRGPVMLYPSVFAAWERLQVELGPASPDYARSQVIERFPALDDGPDRDRLMQSVWRADDPHRCAALPLSHAAWWLATQGGTKLVILDDWKVWRSAFEKLRRLLTGAQILILDKDRDDVSPRAFAVVGFDYPCRALLRSPFVAGRHTYVACALTPHESAQGDQFFEAGSDAPRWQNLALVSSHFIQSTGG
ncbi:MAG: hypothetical protein ACLPKB_09930 [Xanthobacteraceae bacterium]